MSKTKKRQKANADPGPNTWLRFFDPEILLLAASRYFIGRTSTSPRSIITAAVFVEHLILAARHLPEHIAKLIAEDANAEVSHPHIGGTNKTGREALRRILKELDKHNL